MLLCALKSDGCFEADVETAERIEFALTFGVVLTFMIPCYY